MSQFWRRGESGMAASDAVSVFFLLLLEMIVTQKTFHSAAATDQTEPNCQTVIKTTPKTLASAPTQPRLRPYRWWS